MSAFFPSLFRSDGIAPCQKEGSFLDRMLKRYLVAEAFLGLCVMGLGLLMGGQILFALGACMLGFSAQCAAHTTKGQMAAVLFGILSLLLLAVGCLRSFGMMVSLTDYGTKTSSLSVLLVIAVLFLLHRFLALPVEDRPEYSMLRHGMNVLSVFSAMGLVGVALNYLLSYAFSGLFLSNLEEWDRYVNEGVGSAPVELQDFHYVEGLVALALCITAIRAVVRAYFGEEPVEEPEKEIEE